MKIELEDDKKCVVLKKSEADSLVDTVRICRRLAEFLPELRSISETLQHTLVAKFEGERVIRIVLEDVP